MLAKHTPTPLDAQTFLIEERTKFSQGLCYLLCGTDAALLIDTGMPMGNIRETVDKLTDLPVTVVNTHAHTDHIGSNFRFDDIYYHEDDRDVFALHTDAAYVAKELLKTEIPVFLNTLLSPVIKRLAKVNTSGQYHYIKDGHVFHLGGRDVEAIHTPGHSAGSICLLDRNTRRLFSGDTICGQGILLNLAGSTSPEVYMASVEHLQSFAAEFDEIFPGHHNWPLKTAFMEEFRACAAAIIAGTAEAVPARCRVFAKEGDIGIALTPEDAKARLG